MSILFSFSTRALQDQMESQAYPAPKAQTVIQVETVAPDQEDLKELRYANDINANLQIVSKTNAFL